jgi:uncharacterized protein YaeQ
MALKSTIYKVQLSLADMDRGVYGEHALTLALHPSETEERLMVRLLAWALFAGPGLAFGRGLSAEDEPALALTTADGRISLWVEVGLPDARAVRRALGRAERVVVLAYGARRLPAWWASEREALALPRLTVLALPAEPSAWLAARAARNMSAQCTIQEGRVWWTLGDETLEFVPEAWWVGEGGAPWPRHG